MATLNDGAFAAVDAFFGVDASKKESVASAAAANSHRPETIGNGKRLGVGAASELTTTTTNTTSNNAVLSTSKKRILQVGSKKRRRKVGYGEDDDDDDDDHESRASNSDTDDDEGRTAIDRGQKKSAVPPQTNIVGQPQQKKKLGKKERQRLAQEQAEKEQVCLSTTDDVKDPAATGEQPEVVPTNKRNNRKKKVRSRQKNICKDHRDVKPEHLVPGNRNYQGRPLTPETRSKLHLPVLAKSPFPAEQRRWDQGNWNDDNNDDAQAYDDDGNGYADDSMNGGVDLDAMPLAVDRPIAESDTGTSVPLMQSTTKKRKTTVTGKAKKYKNLV